MSKTVCHACGEVSAEIFRCTECGHDLVEESSSTEGQRR
jgi:rRNA maturation endonuclease Nob1